ncbi:MAG: hypothetical protein QOG23_740 [Blastocatellia bacterium]|nr:hypothetical protein [Blastocatellia bacterium]
MTTSTLSNWTDDLPVIGKLAPLAAASKLRELGEDELADQLEVGRLPATTEMATYGKSLHEFWPFKTRAWQHTSHVFGYLSPTLSQEKTVAIRHAGTIDSDPTLKNSRIKITLDRLRVADYPGSGTHRVLFDFYAQNQVRHEVQHVHFNASYRIREGEQAGIAGYPIFVGLKVGGEGVAFRCFTVNVKNDSDEAYLDVLESDVFKAGLKLSAMAQPAIAPLSSLAVGVTKCIARRNRNVPVQDFYLGLDFTQISTRARLAEGSYIAVQVPELMESVWDWDEWAYSPNKGQIVSRSNSSDLIPYNYVIFSVSRYVDR